LDKGREKGHAFPCKNLKETLSETEMKMNLLREPILNDY